MTAPGRAAFRSATTLFLISYQLPDIREYFATEPLPRGLPSAHHALGGAEDGDAETAEHPRDLGLARVHTQTGAADPLHTGDDPGAVRAGLEDDTHRLGGAVRLDVIARDVTLVLEDTCDLELQTRGRDLDLGMAGRVGVADARQHVGDGVAD